MSWPKTPGKVKGESGWSRGGRKDDVQEAMLIFVEAVLLAGPTESLVLTTTSPTDRRAQGRAGIHLYLRPTAI